MPYQRYSLDIVIPCYNPDEGWEDKLIYCYQKVDSAIGDGLTSLILVNDGSSVGLKGEHIEKIEKATHQFQYLENAINKGKGHALRLGVAKSNSELVIFTDVDFPYQADSLLDVYRELCAGTDVALGYREQDYYKNVPVFRKLLSKILRWVLSSVLKLSIADTQCGLKGFNKKGRKVFLSTTIHRFLFDLEFVMLASRDDTLTTNPVLVSLREGVVFSKVNLKVILTELINFFVITLSKRKSKLGD